MTAQAGSASSPSSRDKSIRDDLRRAMRQRRRALSADERRLAAIQIARSLMRLPFVKQGARIAVYLAVGGEVDLAPFIARARQRGCRLYAPRIVNRRRARMGFFALDARSKLRRNLFGIPEAAAHGPPIPPQRLDVVLAPLVAFDIHGARLGMGAGYYDRYLAHLRHCTHWRRPLLIGVAYDLQRVPPLAAHAWDVRMDAVITESGLHRALPAVTPSS